MSRIVTEPEFDKSRIRELLAAHDEALRGREELLVSAEETTDRWVELNRRARGYLNTLLEEGFTTGRWTAISEKQCILIEHCEGPPFFGDRVLRRAPRKVVEAAPEWAPAEAVDRKSRSISRGRYHEPIARIKRLSGKLALAGLALFAAAVAASVFSGAEVLAGVAVWALISSLVLTNVHLMMRFVVPESMEKVLAEERAASAPVNYDKEEQDVIGAEERHPRRPADPTQAPAVARPETPAGYESEHTAARDADAEEVRVRAPLAPFYHSASPLNTTPRQEPTAAVEGDTEPEDSRQRQQDKRRLRLDKLPEEDLSESFSYAYLPRYNEAQGSDSIRLLEARGELADVLGVEQGETVAEIVWRQEPMMSRPARSFLPYREVVASTSLDPALPPERRVRPASRRELHERLKEDKPLGALQTKVTYRVGPNRGQFFGLPFPSHGSDGGYTLEDKLEYLERRARQLGFEGEYTDEEWERIEEIIIGEGYAPTHEELLRFALLGGMDPRFFFEDSGEELPATSARDCDAGQPVLWRVEAAISEAHGIPVEMFERRLVDYHISEHSWRFR